MGVFGGVHHSINIPVKAGPGNSTGASPGGDGRYESLEVAMVALADRAAALALRGELMYMAHDGKEEFRWLVSYYCALTGCSVATASGMLNDHREACGLPRLLEYD